MASIKVIHDELMIARFFNEVVPNLVDDEVMVVLGVARRKYCPEGRAISSNQNALFREIFRYDDPQRLLRLLLRFEVSEHCYVDKKTGISVPPESVAVYIDLNPKSGAKATASFSKAMTDQYIAAISNRDGLEEFTHLKSRLYSQVVKHNSRKVYKLLDVDSKVREDVDNAIRLLYEAGVNIAWVSQTRGGYHVLITCDKGLEAFYKRVWPSLQKLNGSCEKPIYELPGDCMTPIPGTYQGGVPVRRYDFE